MGWQERDLQPNLSPRHFYGAEIRLHRANNDMSLESLGNIIKFSKAHLSRIESGASKPPEGLSEKLDMVFGTNGLFCRLYELAKREPFPDKYSTFHKLNSRAVEHASYSLSFPGLLQTERVIRAIMHGSGSRASDEEIESWLTARLGQQERLRTEPAVCEYWFIIDEAALQRPIAGPEVMVEQLSALLAAGRRRNVTVQVLPFSAGVHSRMSGSSLIMLTSPDGSMAAYEEGDRWGRLHDDTETVVSRRKDYDLLRAQSLSPRSTEAKISSALEGFAEDARRRHA
ncbi:helix-turn-helix transcriptional regulator [Kitasatospora sp. NA04385]|uniref:helix-turn-helix domain-containing protein n=1 Tax=Kitasatospora sp. NA04385 TaxID=2742135 RepID=UPI0015915F51|nr:helix-turn-helix transcriptional regulator [Kitasatospora sp. NA04385]QKW20215.1 helix-turn-helix transcriptional regulator [Kitasatospora sp. NA04385]